MVIAIAGIFRFPANCHAPSVLLLLLVAEGIDGFAKGSVNFTIGKLIDELAICKACRRTAECLPLARADWALWALRSQSAAG